MKSCIAVVILWCAAATANPINVQGRALNAAGNSVDGQYAFTLAFYTAEKAEKAAYTQSAKDVATSNGVFSLPVDLPSELVNLADSLWVGVSINGEKELPRQPVGRVPYAMQSADLACSGCVSQSELGFALYTKAEVDALIADFITPSDVKEEIAQGGFAVAVELAKVATSGDFSDIKNVPAGLDDGDNDLLGGMKCQEGQVAQWVKGAWQCATLGSVVIASLDTKFIDLAFQFIDGMPGKGTEGFVVPSDLERSVFGEAVDALAAEDLALAHKLAALVDYELVLVQGYRVLRPVAGKNKGRGLYGMVPVSKRNVVVSSPHPRYDFNTGKRTAEAFEIIGARAFAIAGTHRCANAKESGCDGTTGVCGSSAPYRESDQAHTEKGFFQIFHQRISPGRTTLQFHGFKSTTSDPEFTFSDGTTYDSTDPSHLGIVLTADLEKRVAAAGSKKPGNSCNRAGDINKLCGSTNTQGRFLNGLPAAQVCTNSSPKSNQSFIHMELSYDLRNAGGLLEPELIYDAIKAVIPAQ